MIKLKDRGHGLMIEIMIFLNDELLSAACSSLFLPYNSFTDSHTSMFYLQSLTADCFSFKLPPELHFAPNF